MNFLMATQLRNRSSGHIKLAAMRAAPGRTPGVTRRSSASCDSSVGTAAAHERCGSVRDGGVSSVAENTRAHVTSTNKYRMHDFATNTSQTQPAKITSMNLYVG